jgi:hypothetical protein
VLVLPKGATGVGKVKKVVQPGMFGKDGRVDIDFMYINGVDGTKIPVFVGELAKQQAKSYAGAAGAAIGGMIILGPVGVIGGAFVKGSSVVIPEGSVTYVQTTEDVVMQVPIILSPADGDEVNAPTLKVTVKDTPNNGFRFELSKVASFPGRATKVKVAELGEYSVEYDNLEDGEYYIRVATLETPTEYTDFSTPIKISYKYVKVNLDNTELKDIYVIDNLLYAPTGKYYTIYTITGAVIANGITKEVTQLPDLVRGIYMIKVENTILKHVVKY